VEHDVLAIVYAKSEFIGEGAGTVRVKLPSISYIVARSSPDNIIGRGNRLPWHLRTDLQRFKKITIGHPIIMGRKTFLSIGRALPGRANIVLSRTPEFNPENSFWHHNETMLLWAENRESALFFADVIAIAKDKSDFFVIGGAEMYQIFRDLLNKIYLTEVLTGDSIHPEPNDAVFDYKIDNRKWKTLQTQSLPSSDVDDFPSRFIVLERKTKTIRYIEVKDYLTAAESKNKWVKEQLDFFDELNASHPTKPLSVPYQYQLFDEDTLSG
jgi:dihydrofolate reductase